MSELIKKLEAFRANLVGEDMNYRACLVDEAISRIRELEAFLVKVLPAGIEDVCDDCGGDLAKCKAENPDCYIAEARRLLPEST